MKTKLSLLILQAIARGWCSQKNEQKEVDAVLGQAILKEIMAISQLCALVDLYFACKKLRQTPYTNEPLPTSLCNKIKDALDTAESI